MSEDNGKVVSIESKKGDRKRRGDQVVPPDRRSQSTSHLPADATRSEARRAGRVVRAKRRADVMTLAAAGHNPEAIAETLTERYERENLSGITKKSVEDTINKSLTDWQESELATVDKVRAMQLAKLDAMSRAIAQQVAEGKLKAINTQLKIEKLRAQITGTEAPKRLEVSGTVALGVEKEEIERGEQAWLDSGGDVIDLDPAEVEEVPTNAT